MTTFNFVRNNNDLIKSFNDAFLQIITINNYWHTINNQQLFTHIEFPFEMSCFRVTSISWTRIKRFPESWMLVKEFISGFSVKPSQHSHKAEDILLIQFKASDKRRTFFISAFISIFYRRIGSFLTPTSPCVKRPTFLKKVFPLWFAK